ncbi:MAG TPA: oligosaccharide flippase family protein, partial [Ignavibacteriales bacterium]|nr:oligosaccharide flippase family protein [Ignavibacteriales bacterium]
MKPGALLGKALHSGFLRNLSYVSAAKLLTAVFSILVKIYVVRVLTKEEFGTITILLSLYTYFVFLSEMSVSQVVQKDIVGSRENYWDKYNLFANSKIYTVLFSVILFFITAYLMGYTEYYVDIAILSLSVVFDALYRQ